MIPVKISIDSGLLTIVWDNGDAKSIKLANLRRFCPCANCSSEREKNIESYIPIYTGNQLKIEEIKIVGSYAINIIWADGHNTGIYDYTYLLSKFQE